ncbi:Citrate lyase beta subunit [Chelatococcus sambhunathii]|uniref:Citrate lyase beta subunit n=1 Tax=Chelatococcus sambhunathii TaxID=363953 RepID=A0ABM9U8A0_9HYPH|nr:CoA ester lyase [Chelatococcus sambhunathii]CUA88942.1 Citrate lyase beta subunit [Chelatococcus sambhunathii]
MTEIRPRRSALYMPGSNARALEKARSLPADVVILDLEDAVAPEAKEAARAQVSAAVTAGGFGPREVIVRVNGLDTPWGEEDLAAAIACVPDAILLPKVSTPAVLATVGRRLATAGAPHKIRIWAMVETPLAILNIAEIAAAAADQATRLECFVMGTNDLAKETGARLVPGRAPMLPWLATSLAAARAHGLSILDGVYNNLSDADGFAAECAAGRDMGFDGKTLIHPGQIAAANAAFAPEEAEVAHARAIIAAFDAPENAGKGAINLDGRMVERLHAAMARRTVSLAEAIAARE